MTRKNLVRNTHKRRNNKMAIEIQIVDGKELWQCHNCKRWFFVKKGNNVDALLVLGRDGDNKLQCMGCSGGYVAVDSYLRCVA